MQAFLKKHSGSHAEHAVKVNWSQVGRTLTLNFEVKKRTKKPWLVDEAFTSDWSKNWGLWNKDVVEAFIQLRPDANDTKAPYLEVQLSPLNQPFALIIYEPRVNFQAPKSFELKSESQIEGSLWKAQLDLTLPQELAGNEIFGGFFACLGSDPREYYALEPNPENNPDFHRPELFLPLGT
jgi:hypothetical protein